MGNNHLHFETKRIHSGYDPKEHFNAVNPPIYQTAGFKYLASNKARFITGSQFVIDAGLLTD